LAKCCAEGRRLGIKLGVELWLRSPLFSFQTALLSLEAMAHVFKRENGKNLTEQCQICENRWRPGGEGIAAYVRCKECGTTIYERFLIEDWRLK